MGFPQNVMDAALVACGRSCCICHKFCGVNIEGHHIVAEAKGGDDSFDNCIPVCFDCHADVGHYNTKHPRGKKYTPTELRKHRDNWYAQVEQLNRPLRQPEASEGPSKIVANTKSVKRSVTMVQASSGGKNIQAAGDVHQHNYYGPVKEVKKISPPPNTIGANANMKKTIQGMIKKLVDYRYQRFGKSGPPVVYRELNKRFGLSSINDLWLKDDSIYQDVCEYLTATYNNTIEGRIKKAASRPGYRHTRGHLMQKSVDAINNLGWKDAQFRTWLFMEFGVSSRKDLSDGQLDDMIMSLERLAKEKYRIS